MKRKEIHGPTLCRLYQHGGTVGDLQLEFGIGAARVIEELKAEGIPIRKHSEWLSRPRPNRQVQIDSDYLRACAAKHMTTKEIGLGLGCSEEAVRARMVKLDIPRRDKRGDRNPAWKGERKIDADGYVLLFRPDHPYANKSGYVREHRLVMEKKIGRYLHPKEVIHHRDKNKQNNDPDNLELFAKNADHLKAELTGHCPKWTPEGRERTLVGVRRRWQKAVANPPGLETDAPPLPPRISRQRVRLDTRGQRP